MRQPTIFAVLLLTACPQSDDTGSTTDTGTTTDTGSPVDTGTGFEPTDCFDYRFADASYMHTMSVALDGDPCCFDLNGDGPVDNAFGAVLDSLAAVDTTLDPNAYLDAAIRAGDLCQTLEFHGMSAVTDSDSFPLALFPCLDADSDYDDNLSGQEGFQVPESAFVEDAGECTADPGVRFTASVDSSVLSGTTDGPIPLALPFMFPDRLLEATVQEARIQADLSTDSSGIVASNGKLGGAIAHTALWDYLDEAAASECSCLGVTGDLVEWQQGLDTLEVSCQDLGASTCGDGDPSLCGKLATMCAVIPILPNIFDVDLNGDAIKDAMSIGLTFETTPAEITGVTATQ